MVDIIKVLEKYVEQSELFKSFDYGEDIEMNINGDKLYPQLFMEEPMNILMDEADYFNYEFAILMMDYENKERLYKNDTINIQKIIDSIRDFVKFIESNGFIVSKPLGFITLRDFSSDQTCGIRIELGLKKLKKC